MSVRALGLALVGLSFGGCWEQTGLVETTIRYRLTAFNQQDLPVSIGTALSLEYGFLELRADGTCDRTLMATVSGGPEQVDLGGPCEWNRSVPGIEVRIIHSLSPDGPVHYFTATGVEDGDFLQLEVPTGVVCVTTPCPSEHIETYVLDG